MVRSLADFNMQKMSDEWKKKKGLRQIKEHFDDVMKRYEEPQYEDEFARCVQCGYCRNTSATYQVTRMESDSMPGRMFVIDRFLKNNKNWKDPAYRKKIIGCIYHMTNPGYAEKICPANIKHSKALGDLREKLFNEAASVEEFSAMKNAINNLKDPKRENIFGKKKEQKFNWLSEIEHRRSDYLYFVGSYDLLNNHDRVRRILWLLNKFKIPYTVSRFEPDSGFIAQEMGDSVTGVHFGSKVKNLVEDMLFRKIIVSCPNELHRLKQIFDDPNIEVTHIMEIVFNKISMMGSKKIHRIKARVSYLDSFYLSRYYSYSMPRKILRDIGCEMVEKVHSKAESFSSGAEAGFQINFPEDAEKIAELHLKEAETAKADYLVTNDSYAENLLATTAKKKKSKVKVMDMMSLVVKALKWVM